MSLTSIDFFTILAYNYYIKYQGGVHLELKIKKTRECAICGKERNTMVSVEMETVSQPTQICITCFLLSIPSFKLFSQIDDIDKSLTDETYNDVNDFNLFLYNKIKSNYQTNEASTTCNNETLKESSHSSGSISNLTETQEEVFYGREKELHQIINILSRKTKRNPIIVGPAGSGKTAIVKKLAHMLSDDSIPPVLKKKNIWSLDVLSMLSGSKYRGDFEKKIETALDTIIKKENAIIFIDEVHNIIKGDCESTSGASASASDILKPYMSSDAVQIIGATTIDEYRNTIEKDPAMARRFQPVFIEEPSLDEVYDILKNVAPSFSKYHNVKIPDTALADCVALADKYIKYRSNPDKSIDLLDMACVIASSRNSLLNTDSTVFNEIFDKYCNKYFMYNTETELVDIIIDSKCRKVFKEMSLSIQEEVAKYCKHHPCIQALTKNDLIAVIEDWTKIPVSTMSTSYKNQMKTMEQEIKSAVIGQDNAINKVVSMVTKRRLAITESKRPASFIFVGETGVGKTELAKSLARTLFGNEDKLIRFDMSEYMEAHTVSKLIGAPPGYVGYNQPGLLTEAIKRHPFSVILFDEIEKAHTDISNILLQLLDDGRITDSNGVVIDASNTIIILTSNAGSNLTKGIGFGKDSQQVSEEAFFKGLESVFRPEFLGRVDEIIPFNNLTADNYEGVARIHLDKLVSNLAKSNITLTYDDNVPEYICKKSNTAKYHAREIKRTVTKYVENAILTAVMANDNLDYLNIEVSDDNSSISIIPKQVSIASV